MFGKDKINDPYNTMGAAPTRSGPPKARKRATSLNAQALKAQEECLRAKGYGYEADTVKLGLAEYDQDWLETLTPLSADERAARPQKFSW